jgi:uncharacterized protein (DUF111 family)
MMEYYPTGDAKDLMNVLNIRSYWMKEELRNYMLETGVFANQEIFENAIEDLLTHGYARARIIENETYLSSRLPPHTLKAITENEHRKPSL